MRFLWIFLPLALLGSVQAATVVLLPSKDNSMFGSEVPRDTYSDGQGTGLYVGNTGGEGLRRALIEFDIAAAIPAGSIITDVTLKLTLTKAPNAGVGPNNVTVSLFRLTQDWGEGASNSSGTAGGGGGAPAQAGDATWVSNFHGTSTWSTPGGTYVSQASASKSVGRGDELNPVTHRWFGSISGRMITDVQGWLDNPNSNFGWILLGEETADYAARRFGSGEGVESFRPTLTIEYIPEPAAMGLLLSAGVVLGLSRNRRRSGKSAHERI